MKIAPTWLIAGAQGQDGVILSKQLVNAARGGMAEHKIVAVGRRRLDISSRKDLVLDSLKSNDSFHYEICDFREASSVFNLLKKHKPTHIFNFSALSNPFESWSNFNGTIQNDSLAYLNILEAVIKLDLDPFIVNACSASIFKVSKDLLCEHSAIDPKNPYALAKYLSLQLSRLFASQYGTRVSNAIMFNHESNFRSEEFLTRKITRTVANIKNGRQEKLELRNITAIRDWGWAEDYIEGLRRIASQEIEEDFVLATGIGCSVADFTSYVFNLAGMNAKDYLVCPDLDPANSQIDISVGDASKIYRYLGWEKKYIWKDVAEKMLTDDLELIKSLSN